MGVKRRTVKRRAVKRRAVQRRAVKRRRDSSEVSSKSPEASSQEKGKIHRVDPKFASRPSSLTFKKKPLATKKHWPLAPLPPKSKLGHPHHDMRVRVL
jgi:hypothetical protein